MRLIPSKRLFVKLLPQRLLFMLKKRYYTNWIKTFWERDMEPVKCLVKPGDVVLDIGANVGWYTRLLCSLVGKEGKVYAVEPIPETYKLLSAVIKRLGLTNVQTFNYAVSETDGSATMEIPLRPHDASEDHYQARLCDGEGTSTLLRQWTVHLRALDSMFSEVLGKVAFIKCDVEGHELPVIKGACRLITQSKPAWLLEVSGNPDEHSSTAQRVFQYLSEHGYTAYWFDGRRLKRRLVGDRSTNYVFLQPSHLPRLRVLIEVDPCPTLSRPS